MSKALEALENIKHYDSRVGLHESDYSIIETALKEYEEGIENAKTYVPHTAKNALFDLECLAMRNTSRSFWKLPQQLANDVKKELKALEIIKEKRVDTYLLCSCNSVDEYNSMFEHRFGSYDKRALTQEDYDLLKEVLL